MAKVQPSQVPLVDWPHFRIRRLVHHFSAWERFANYQAGDNIAPCFTGTFALDADLWGKFRSSGLLLETVKKTDQNKPIFDLSLLRVYKAGKLLIH
jgi:hypothetical protein